MDDRVHIQIAFDGMMYFTCSLCGVRSQDRGPIERHLRITHGEGVSDDAEPDNSD